MIEWIMDFNEAAVIANETGMPILALFTTDWCEWCLILEKNVLRHPDVVAWAEGRVLPVRLVFSEKDKDSEMARLNKGLKEAFDANGYPTPLLISSKDKVLSSLGEIEDTLYPEDFIRNAEEILSKHGI